MVPSTGRMRKKLSDAEKAKREAKRERRAAASPAAPSPSGATLGQLIGRDDLLRLVSKSTGALIREAEAEVVRLGRAHSCATCTAEKGCCKLSVTILFHEALPIADRLRRDGRDTPELRARLAESAELMESNSRNAYRALRRPCTFLDSDERCTVYEQRPRECGAAFVFTPPERCSDLEATGVETLRMPEQELRGRLGKTELTVEQSVRMVRLEGPYVGALPRMVLLALEAWDRSDFAAYLAEHAPAAAARLFAASKRA